MFAATLLGIVAMTLSKISSAFLIERVATQKGWRRIGLYGMIATYAIFSLFSISFECGIPEWTTRSLQCGQAPLLITGIALNMMTDLALAFWIVPTLWHLSLDKEKVKSAVTLFGVRAMYVPISFTQASTLT